METTALGDMLSAMSVWSGQSLVTWAGELTSTARTPLDQFLTSPAVLGAHATIAGALVHWGAAAMAATMVGIRVLPRMLSDR